MIIHKIWTIHKKDVFITRTDKEGWFLFGFIPLYIRTISVKEY